MAVYNTTDILDSSAFLKAKLDKNMVGTNYYIENLQYRRDQDWEYRYNRVDIEEELNKQMCYTPEMPVYTPIEVVIREAKSIKTLDLGTDWANIAFKDLNHPTGLGYRYRFSYDFPNMQEMSEEEKYYNCSIWLAINFSPINAGREVLLRRCNSSIALVGSPTRKYDDITEIHYEPVIIENDLKYTNIYYNQTLVIPQANWYATMQMNYFTNNIEVNDRFIFPGVDLDSTNKDNNVVYKVKAVVKNNMQTTFARNGSPEIQNIPLVTVALDKDVIDSLDDFETRVANVAPIYYVGDYYPTNEYYIKVEEPCETRLLLGEIGEYKVNLYKNNEKYEPDETIGEEINYNITTELEGVEPDDENAYYLFTMTSENSFAIKNLKTYNAGTLNVHISCINPDNLNEELSIELNIELGGFY